jgi:hypothetical protein
MPSDSPNQGVATPFGHRKTASDFENFEEVLIVRARSY